MTVHSIFSLIVRELPRLLNKLNKLLNNLKKDSSNDERLNSTLNNSLNQKETTKTTTHAFYQQDFDHDYFGISKVGMDSVYLKRFGFEYIIINFENIGN